MLAHHHQNNWKTYQQKSYFLHLGFVRLELFTNKF